MTTSPEGITLLGSEMLTWSDLEGEVGGFGGLLAPHLLHAFGGHRGRVLVAGPTTAEVVAGVAAQFGSADVLVRSWLDAQALRAALDPAVSVHCGPLDRMRRPGSGYDAVVAVAGIDRLHSAEEDTPTWRAVLGDLAGLLNDTGELYVAVGNPVGIDRLVGVPHPSRTHDADWPQGHAGVEDPRDAGEVLADLATHGLTEVDTWVCHGSRLDPATASPREVLTALRDDPVLLREVAAAYRDPAAVAAGLRDPATTTRDLLRAGLGVATAPLSVLHVRRGQGSADTTRTVLLVSEPARPARAAYILERSGEQWQRTLLAPAAPHDLGPSLRRDLSLLEGPVPSGPLLAGEIADHLAQHDASGAGEHVRRFRDWLGEAGPVDRAKVAVPLDRLVVTDRSLVPADASLVADVDADRDTVLVRALLRFAADLLRGGGRHPWSPAATPRALAVSLAAAAGLEVGGPLVEAAVELDRALTPTGQEPLEVDAPLGGLAGTSYADLLELASGLAQRAADQDAHVVWLLRAMQGRQRAIRKARGNLRQVTESREYRLGRRVFWVREKLRRRAERREAAENGPAGEWRDRSEDPEQDEPIVVEEHLVPPGYTPPADVTVIPTGTDVPPPD